MTPKDLLLSSLPIWTSADTAKRSGRGRASGNARSVYGIKKLRELILDLAVRGKLVPQDPSDEPASELLNLIQEEKGKLIAEGKIKKEKPLTPVTDEEKLFELPKGWQWVKLAEIIEYINGYAFSSKDFSDKGIGIVKIGDIQQGRITPSTMSRVSVAVTNNIDSQLQVSKGDLVIAMSGATTGKLGFSYSDEVFYLNQRVGKIVPFQVSPRFLFIDLTTKITANLEKSFGSAIPNLSTEQIKAICVPLPPLAEQHRIVAKVDELMALCDQLENKHVSAAEAHEQLVAELLGALTPSAGSTGSPPGSGASEEHHDFESSWKRLAEHFDVLFTTESSIEALKKTVLQLAVMGKLVRQDPSDEPASELLRKIQAGTSTSLSDQPNERTSKNKEEDPERSRRVRQKPIAPIADEEKPFGLPMGWEWVRLESVTSGMDSGWSPACLENSSPSISTWGVLKTTSVQVMQYLEYENKQLPEKLKPRPEAEVKIGDILFTRAGPMNRVGISCLVQQTRPKLMISDKIIRFHPVEIGLDGRFTTLCLNAGETANYLERAKSGMAASQVNITQEKLRSAPVPLPPLAEQHRIVAKVDELMAICDRLKEKIVLAGELERKMADVVVEAAVG